MRWGQLNKRDSGIVKKIFSLLDLDLGLRKGKKTFFSDHSSPIFAMEADDREMGFGSAAFPPPALVSFSPFPPAISPSPRRLSSNFIAPNRPIRSQKQLAWISLQGRLVGAEEATSARAIGGGLNPKEAVAWDLFSPIQRVLVVAVIAVAATNSKKNKQILELQKSVELRDVVLAAMQEELDSLCEQVNYFKDQPDTMCNISSNKYVEFSGDIKYVGCGCQPCGYHRYSLNDPMGNAFVKASDADIFNYQLPLLNDEEPEERRMSNLSDWASSINSSIDIQLQLDNEQDIYNLRKECEEKDNSIKELSTFLQSSEAISSKRITELEDIIRGKKMIITKLKKDMMILEQKVVHLARLQRPSFTSSNARKLPLMTDNLVYDMDSTTSPSSSDSDCAPRNKPQAPVAKSQKIPVQKNSSCFSMGDPKLSNAKKSNVVVKSSEEHQRSRPVSPLKEKSLNQKSYSESESFPRPKQPLSAGGNLKTRRRPTTRPKDATLQKRWT